MRSLLAGAAALMALSLPANANTINFYNDASDTSSGLRFSVECSLGCEAALFDGTPSTFSDSIGDLIDFPGGSGITGVLADATGESFSSSPEIVPDNDSLFSWTTSAKYITLKIGKKPDFGVLFNTGGAGNEMTFTKISDDFGGGGFSHYREYGEVTTPEVPLPAAAWMLLAGIGGLAAVRRAKKS